MSRQLGSALWTFIGAIIVLLIANASPTSGWAGDTSMLLLALTFLASMIAMAFASTDSRMQLSLQLMTIYFAIYLVLPGYNHASINLFPFFDFSYPPDVRTSAALIILLFIIAVAVGYSLTPRSRVLSPVQLSGRVIRNNGALAAILTIVSVISMAAFLSAVGLSAALSTRETLDNAANDLAGSSFLVTVPRVLTFLPVIYGALLAKFSSRKRIGVMLLLFNVPIFIIVNFPLSLPRSQVFGIILLFALLLMDFKKVSKRGFLSLAYVFGALVAMPVLNHFSRLGGTLATLDIKQLTSSYLSSGDFDGYQSTTNAVVYVDRYGYENGLQLVSAILFFIPRSIWSGKGEPTGTITSEAAGYTFNNVSQPLPSEFYVDFGWAGVVAGGLLVGVLFCRLDRWIDRGWTTDLRTRLAAGWLMGFGLPIFRGTLLGVLPPFVIVAVGLWVIARWGMQSVDYVDVVPQDKPSAAAQTFSYS